MAIQNIVKLEQRADEHWDAAVSLADISSEWSAVAAFYSCYMLARASILADPIFADIRALKSIHLNLTPDDRFTTKHNVHRPRLGIDGFGVNDLIQALYKSVGGTYRTLHRGSINVRYEVGLTKPLTIPVLLKLASSFRNEYQQGNMVYERDRRL